MTIDVCVYSSIGDEEDDCVDFKPSSGYDYLFLEAKRLNYLHKDATIKDFDIGVKNKMIENGDFKIYNDDGSVFLTFPKRVYSSKTTINTGDYSWFLMFDFVLCCLNNLILFF